MRKPRPDARSAMMPKTAAMAVVPTIETIAAGPWPKPYLLVSRAEI
jgi:hypothetical protein